MANVRESDWKPVKRMFYMGDTIWDSFNRERGRFFMPKVKYRRVGARNWRGSVEGEYSSHCGFHQYQSVLRSCRMVLTEKRVRI